MAPSSSGLGNSTARLNPAEEEELELEELKDGQFHHDRARNNSNRDIDEDEELGAKQYQLYSPEEERKVRRRLDRRVVLFIAFLYLLSFLDRSSTIILSASELPGLNVLIGHNCRCRQRQNSWTRNRPLPRAWTV